jgi:hypothetical protein
VEQPTASQAPQPPAPPRPLTTNNYQLTTNFPDIFRKLLPSRARELTRELDFRAVLSDIRRVAQTLGKRAEKLPPRERETFETPLRELTRQLTFMERLNNFTHYVQLPVDVNGEKATAELYVFGNGEGKGKRVDPDNATMFISLDTAALGVAECFVRLAGKNVETDFSLQTQEAASLVSSMLPSLAESLLAQGYSLVRANAAHAESRRDVAAVSAERGNLLSRHRIDAQI